MKPDSHQDNKEEFHHLFGARATEVSAAIALNFFMTIISTFFLGVFFANPNQIHPAHIPILFLIISILGFIFSTLIYTNASDRDAELKSYEFRRHIFIGNLLSEYFGVYFLVFSFPLTFALFFKDSTVSVFVTFVTVVSFLAYHLFGFSVLERYLNSPKTFHLSIYFVCTLLVLSTVFSILNNFIFFNLSGFLLILVIVGLFIMSSKRKPL